MDTKPTPEFMATVKTIKDLLHKRMMNKVELLTTLTGAPLDNIPEAVQLKREEEAAKVRAVIQEQKDLIEIINSLFPE